MLRRYVGYYAQNLPRAPCSSVFRPQNFPEHQFPSIVGRPILRTEEQAGDIVVKDIMCGDEAAAARSMLQISYPVRSTSHVSVPVANGCSPSRRSSVIVFAAGC
jgi:hypothetical protein